jgi:hypothetical protein
MLISRFRFSVFLFLALTTLLAAGCGPAATPTSVIQTVMQTVPVEVTRLAEVTQQVEVTRQVMVTQLVEVTVTPPVSETPSQGIPMTQTPTPAVPNPTGQAQPSSQVTPYSWITPDQKGEGFTPVFIQNETGLTMKVAIYGPTNLEATVSSNGTQKIWLRRGDYSFQTWKDDRKSYAGSFKIASADKHLLILRDTKAVFWIP